MLESETMAVREKSKDRNDAPLTKQADAALIAAFSKNPQDAAEIRTAILVGIKARGVSTIAEKTGLNRSGLYRTFIRERSVSMKRLMLVLDALGFRLKIERK